MSTFDGILTELPNIIVDNFLEPNHHATCYFLSHCHSDHMRGLFDDGFIDHLKNSKDVFLYCSSISKLILKSNKKLAAVSDKIKDLNAVCTITVPAGQTQHSPYSVTVSSIPAGHCPGSVMFLFETSKFNILYTGDFRIASADCSKFLQLKDKYEVKKIDTVYLDSTFFSPAYYRFPSRQESISYIVQTIQEWLAKRPDNEVEIFMPAKYGGEALLVDISNALSCRIHVTDELFELFRHVPEVISTFTDNPQHTRIHSYSKHTAHHARKENTLRIKPCAQSFRCHEDSETVLMKRAGTNVIKVNYSSHSSYSEVKVFMEYLKPRKIVFCTDICGVGRHDKYLVEAIPDLISSWSQDTEDVSVTSENESHGACLSSTPSLCTSSLMTSLKIKPLAAIEPPDNIFKPLKLIISPSSLNYDLELDSPPMKKKHIL